MMVNKVAALRPEACLKIPFFAANFLSRKSNLGLTILPREVSQSSFRADAYSQKLFYAISIKINTANRSKVALSCCVGTNFPYHNLNFVGG